MVSPFLCSLLLPYLSWMVIIFGGAFVETGGGSWRIYGKNSGLKANGLDANVPVSVSSANTKFRPKLADSDMIKRKMRI